MASVIDMRDFGSVNDDSFDNTDALLAALAARGNGEPSEIFFAAGDWHFSGALPIGTLEDFDNVSLSGEFWAPAAQHQEESSGNAIKDRTRLVIHMDGDALVWWKMIRPYRFGPVAFRDLTFQIADQGSLFQFGDPASETIAKTLSGLCFERCYFTRLKHYGSDNIGGDGGAWLLDQTLTSDGFTLNGNGAAFGLLVSQCYDVKLDVYVRGFKWGVINDRSDMPAGDVRAQTCGFGLLETFPSGVASQWSRVVGENCILAGAALNGRPSNVRCESNPANYAVTPGKKNIIPTSAEWVGSADSDHIDFTFRTGGPFTCVDYFEPYLVYEFTPTNTVSPLPSPEPPFFWLVTKVTASSVYGYAVKNTTTNLGLHNYLPRDVRGNGTNVTQYFGVPSICYDKFDCGSYASVSNINDLPHAFWCPGSWPMRFIGDAKGRGNLNPDALGVQVVSRCAGDQDSLYSFISAAGDSHLPNHPDVVPVGFGPANERRFRGPVKNLWTGDLLFGPGKGVSSIDFHSRMAIYWPLTEEDGSQVWGVSPQDLGAYYYSFRPLPRDNVLTMVSLRVYVPTGPCTIVLNGGGTPLVTFANLAGGQWHTLSTTLAAGQVVADANGAFINVNSTSNVRYYISQMVVNQNPARPVYSGVYTPNATGNTNVGLLSTAECQFLRVGDSVTVSGMFGITPSGPNALTIVNIPLPISSNLTGAQNCAGTAYAIDAPDFGGVIYGDTTNDCALLAFTTAAATARIWAFHFTYRLL
jgi:hypothetical protein